MFSILFVCINATYIILTFYRSTLQVYRDVGKTLYDHKRSYTASHISMKCGYWAWPYFWIYSYSQLYVYSLRCYLYSFASVFSDVLITNPPYILSGESHHRQISIGLDYNMIVFLLLRKLQTLLHEKCPTTGNFCKRRSVVC